jgi:hypothetical protein
MIMKRRNSCILMSTRMFEVKKTRSIVERRDKRIGNGKMRKSLLSAMLGTKAPSLNVLSFMWVLSF